MFDAFGYIFFVPSNTLSCHFPDFISSRCVVFIVSLRLLFLEIFPSFMFISKYISYFGADWQFVLLYPDFHFRYKFLGGRIKSSFEFIPIFVKGLANLRKLDYFLSQT